MVHWYLLLPVGVVPVVASGRGTYCCQWAWYLLLPVGVVPAVARAWYLLFPVGVVPAVASGRGTVEEGNFEHFFQKNKI